MKTKRLCLTRFIGGKFHHLDRFLSLIPEHRCYCEVFGGAAAFLLNKPPSLIEVYNDIDGELVNLFEVIRDNPTNFAARAAFLLYSRELHAKWKEDLGTDEKVERAIRFYYLLQSGFSGMVDAGWAFSRPRRMSDEGGERRMPLSLQLHLAQIRKIHNRLKHVYIDHLDFVECIKKWDSSSTFFYLDPPYYEKEYYRFGIEKKRHLELAKLLPKVRGKWLLSYNNHPKIRELYNDFNMTTFESRKCAEKLELRERHTHSELLIKNYD